MHWTFAEYDSTSAVDMFIAFELWRLMDGEKH
jgi:hypothetical protein